MTIIDRAPCGCLRTETVVGTCPQCLPGGAITWLIENGRQLELFLVDGVLEPVRGLESIEKGLPHPPVTNGPQRSAEGLLSF